MPKHLTDMDTRILRNIIVALGIAFLLAACNASRDLPWKTVSTDKLYRDSLMADTVSMATKTWSELFTDKQLQSLIREGIDSSLDLQIAIQRVNEAEAYFRQSKANLLPGISAIGEASFTKNSKSLYPNGSGETKFYELGASASWEIDIWGKLRRAKRASYANLLASDAGRKAVQTRLVADIATAYYTLLGLDAKLDITQKTVQTNIEQVETMKIMKDNGRVNGAAVVQSEAARYAAEVTVPDLKQQILEAENALCLLLGRPGEPVVRGKLVDQPSTPAMQTGIPAMLLENRPDVMQAEYELMAAYETTRSAHAYFFPMLKITAQGGFMAVNTADLLNPTSLAGNIIAGLTQPIFNNRANIARLKVSKAQQEEALLNFRSTLYNAGIEVQNAMGSYLSAQAKEELRQKQIDALLKSVSYTKELLTYGTASYLEVLSAQQSLLAAQISSVNDRLQQLDAVVSLYRALGGGWR